jgi:hypothetical protein
MAGQKLNRESPWMLALVMLFVGTVVGGPIGFVVVLVMSAIMLLAGYTVTSKNDEK